MPFALIAGLLGIGGSIIGAAGATSAANTQAQAAEQAAQIQQQEWQQTQKNEAPYLAAGGNSLQALMQGLGLAPGSNPAVANGALTAPFNPQQSPELAFQLQQGTQALTDAATATGGVGGGNTLKALVGYGQGVGSQNYQQQFSDYMAQNQNTFNDLQTLAGSGQNAAANLGALGSQNAQTVGQDLIGGANATAAGQVGAANAISGGINGIGSNYLLAQILGQTGGAGGAGSYNFSPSLPNPYTMGTGLTGGS